MVQVDLEESVLGAHRPADRPLDLGVVGDCALRARDVLAVLDGAAVRGAPAVRSRAARAPPRPAGHG